MRGKLNKVVVFFGGKSVEREISIITGVQVMRNINSLKNEIIPVYINENGQWLFSEELKEIDAYKNLNKVKIKKVCFLPNQNKLFEVKGSKLKPIAEVDCVINCCHGTGGEDGCLSGVIESTGIAFASPSVLAGSVSMDKQASKFMFKGLGLNVLHSISVLKKSFLDSKDEVLNKIDKFGYPVVVKPCNLGSSVGVSFCKTREDAEEALAVAFEFDDMCLVEMGLENFDEFFCSCVMIKNEIVVSEIEKSANNEFLDFNKKYISSKKRNFPAKIKKGLKLQIQNQTKTIYEALKCRGIIRVDFLFDKNKNELFVNEANVVPGSLAMGFWSDKLEICELFDDVMLQAKNDYQYKKNFNSSFKSNILENFEKGTKNKLK